MLFVARAVVGLGFSAGLMASYKSTATWVPAERRSLANTAIMSVGALGMVVASEPTEYLVGLIGWREPSWSSPASSCSPPSSSSPRAPGQDTSSSPRRCGSQFGQMLAIMQDAGVLAPRAAAGPHLGRADRHPTLWTGPWFRDVMGLSREEVARHLLLLAVAFMVGILSVGVIADRLGRRGIAPCR